MRLKKLTITNFTSYQDSGGSVDFDPRLNVIVGRNGSGKSNIFRAVEFVLCDSKSEDGKLAFLNTNVNPELGMSVEMILSSRGEDTISGGETSVKRVMQGNKDQYYVNGKLASKMQVANLLQASGLSASNPYFIVKQSKINEVATAPDSMRLQIFYDVIGASYYERKRDETTNIMASAGMTIQRICHLSSTSLLLILLKDNSLKTYENDKDEFIKYLKLEADKGYLLTSIVDSEIDDAQSRLDRLFDSREELAKASDKINHEMCNLSSLVAEKEQKLRSLQLELEGYQNEQRVLAQGSRSLYEQQCNLDAMLETAIKRIDSYESNHIMKIAECDKKIENIKQSIMKSKEEIEHLDVSLKGKMDLKVKAEHRLKTLFDSGIDVSKASDAKEIKDSVGKEMRAKKAEMRKFENQIKNENRSLNEMKDSLPEKETGIEAALADLSAQYTILEDWKMKFAKARQNVIEATEEKQKVLHNETAAKVKINEIKDHLRDLRVQLARWVGERVVHGADCMQEMISSLKKSKKHLELVAGYRGLLIDIISTEKVFYSAIEVTARGRLFSHIVDTDKNAAALVHEYNLRKYGGVVNIVPLNKVVRTDALSLIAACKQSKYLKFPLFSKIRCPKDVEAAVQHILGRYVLTNNFFKGTQEAIDYGVKCVSIEGDRMTEPGFLDGGFIDPRNSKIAARERYLALNQTLKELELDLTQMDERLNAVDARLNVVTCEMTDMSTNVNNEEKMYQKLNIEYRTLQKGFIELKEKIKVGEKKIKSLEATKLELSQVLNILSSELSAPDSELEIISGKNIRLMNDDIERITEKKKLLEGNLLSLIDSMERTILDKHALSQKSSKSSAEVTLDKSKIDMLKENKNELTKRILEHEDDVKKISDRIQQQNSTIESVTQELQSLKEKEDFLNVDIQKSRSALVHCVSQISGISKLYEKAAFLHDQIEKLNGRKIEIGVSTSDSKERCSGIPRHEYSKKIDEINHELEKYKTLNKNALGDYKDFTLRREELRNRFCQAESEGMVIDNFLKLSDEAKARVLNDKFQEFSTKFTAMFQKLIPTGHASLTVMKILNATSSASTSTAVEEGSIPSQIPSNCVGLGIHVRFNLDQKYVRSIEELSGGQKTVVAVAIILALQQVNPAPFYIFDEIDQALDDEYRSAVTTLIHEMSRTSQCLTTTFRPELINLADKLIGVSFQNKTSSMRDIERKTALEFVSKT
ncbi:hypothetical protein ACOME3_009986 [Neoechinorhynchus agilis]